MTRISINQSLISDKKRFWREIKVYIFQLKDQRKLEDLCREQEKIISKLEDLFSKTRINIDSRKFE